MRSDRGEAEKRRRGEEEEKEEEDEEEKATNIKSNNPHLAGGEKTTNVSISSPLTIPKVNLSPFTSRSVGKIP